MIFGTYIKMNEWINKFINKKIDFTNSYVTEVIQVGLDIGLNQLEWFIHSFILYKYQKSYESVGVFKEVNN